MASPLPSAKRRKLDATTTLTKPFVSPMRGPKPGTPLNPNPSKANVLSQPYLPSTLAHTINPASSKTLLSIPKTQNAAPAKATPARKTLPQPRSTTKPTDPDLQAAQKAVTSLEFQIRKQQNDIDTLLQARRLRTSSTDADLSALIDKWRETAQAVAEELFGSVKERVQRMGGVAAWREMEKNKYDRSRGFAQPVQEESDDADCEFDEEGEELPEVEQEYRRKMKRQAKREMLEAADVPEEPVEEAGEREGKVWQEEGRDDDVSWCGWGDGVAGEANVFIRRRLRWI